MNNKKSYYCMLFAQFQAGMLTDIQVIEYLIMADDDPAFVEHVLNAMEERGFVVER